MSLREGWNFIVRPDIQFGTVNVWIIHQHRDGSRDVIAPLDMSITREMKPHEIPPEPTLKFHGDIADDFLRGMADGLVAAGYKPDELKASDKEVSAIKNHLEDMRSQVFKEKTGE